MVSFKLRARFIDFSFRIRQSVRKRSSSDQNHKGKIVNFGRNVEDCNISFDLSSPANDRLAQEKEFHFLLLLVFISIESVGCLAKSALYAITKIFPPGAPKVAFFLPNNIFCLGISFQGSNGDLLFMDAFLY